MHRTFPKQTGIAARPPASERDFAFERSDRFSPNAEQQFRDLFRQVFGKSMGAEDFKRKYLCTPLGYSYHGLMLADGRIVGAYNFIPYAYDYFGTRRLFGLSVDTMTAAAYRGGPFNLVNMVQLTYEALRRDGIGFVFGFPNENVYRFTRDVLKWRDIAELDFYALPINIGAVRSKLTWANVFSRLGASGFLRLPGPRRQPRCQFGVEKICDGRFEEHRYGREHQVVALTETGGKCFFRYCLEADGVRTVYIIDVLPFSAACFVEAVRAVHALTAKRTDLILYVGRLPFGRAGLVRVPPSRRPRRIMMCGKVLDEQLIDERVLRIDNWNVNLSNFDVR